MWFRAVSILFLTCIAGLRRQQRVTFSCWKTWHHDVVAEGDTRRLVSSWTGDTNRQSLCSTILSHGCSLVRSSYRSGGWLSKVGLVRRLWNEVSKKPSTKWCRCVENLDCSPDTLDLVNFFRGSNLTIRGGVPKHEKSQKKGGGVYSCTNRVFFEKKAFSPCFTEFDVLPPETTFFDHCAKTHFFDYVGGVNSNFDNSRKLKKQGPKNATTPASHMENCASPHTIFLA